MTTFAEDFKREMERRGLTVADVARRSGINKGTLHHYLRGDYVPKQARVEAIAKALHVSPADLCGFGAEPAAVETVRDQLISKIMGMDEETVDVLNQLADQIIGKRQQ